MDLTSSFIGVLGLALEMIGLGFLFFELLRSKKTTYKEDALESFYNSLETNVIELQLNMYKVFSDVLKSMQILCELNTDMPDDKLWKMFSDRLKSASKNLRSSEEIKNIKLMNTVAAAELVKNFKEISEENQRLRKIAITGIAFVLLGATMQLADMTVL